MIDVKTIYWIAGMLDGEGNFRFGTSPAISISSVDEDIIVRIRSIISPNQKLYTSTTSTKKTLYRFTIHGIIAIGWMMTIYPIMCRRRKEKIREVIAAWKIGTAGMELGKDRDYDKEKLYRTAKRIGLSKEDIEKMLKETLELK